MATFTLYSLMQSGFTKEASKRIGWLLRAIAGDPARVAVRQETDESPSTS
jgi:hypothetical protein